MKKTSSSENPETSYLAFLRGINVGGRKVLMGELKNAFESLGFKNVKTLIASGNVAFDTPKADLEALSDKIGEKLKETFGYEIGVILRTAENLRKMVVSNPFKNVKVIPGVKLYVTFYLEKPKTGSEIPYQSLKKEFRVLKVSDGEIFSVVDLSQGGRTVDFMNVIEKEFGKKVTTRNWNTITKLDAIND
jgi:uncharacterized protein (DUF1697 family)